MNAKNNNDTPRFNIADVIIIIALVAVITALALRIYNIVGVDNGVTDVKIEFEVVGVSEENLTLKENAKLYSAGDNSLAGYIESFSLQNTLQYAYNEDGELVRAVVPGKKDIKGTMVLSCTKTDKGFYLGGTHLLSEGETLTLYTTTREMSFKIVKIIDEDSAQSNQSTTASTVSPPAITPKIYLSQK